MSDAPLPRAAAARTPAAVDARVSAKAETFTESVIREMTRLALQHGGGQPGAGVSRLRLPAGAQGSRQGGDRRGRQPVRDHLGRAASSGHAIADKVARTYPGWDVDPEPQITVTCGVDRGDDRDDAGAASIRATRSSSSSRSTRTTARTRSCPARRPRYVTLHEPDWSIDEAELRAAFTDRTRAIIVNTPHNPTGKVFTPRRARRSSPSCASSTTCSCFTDEIYEHILYLGRGARPAGDLPGLDERTVTINALSKTYAVTGWRVGWAIAPPAADRRDPQGPRLPDRRRRGAAAGRRRRGDGLPDELLRAHGGEVPGAPRSALRRRSPIVGFRVPRSRRRVLRPVRHPRRRPGRRRRRLRAPRWSRSRRRCGTRLVLPADPDARPPQIRFAFPKRLETLTAAAERLEKLRV